MSRTINKVILVGNVGRDPGRLRDKEGNQGRAPESGDQSSAVSETKVSNGPTGIGSRFGAGLAQFTEENVKKGDRIYIEGRLEYDAYEREGVKIPTADVSVRELVLLTAREAEVQVAA